MDTDADKRAMPRDADIAAATERLRDALRGARPESVVFFGGAGVSVESGIPDFRSPGGLYSQQGSFTYPPEVMLSRSFFDAHPAEFFDFYFSRMLPGDARPNRAHRKLAQLEADGTLRSVVTQNIDGLHQAAGSRRVLELHGSVLRNRCMRCGRAFDLPEMLRLRQASLEAGGDGVPRCPACGGVAKPEVVLYEEPLDESVLESALADIESADILLVAGTSLVVNPAASLVGYFRGSCLAIVNTSPTWRDASADICIPASIGDVLDF